jgi:tetratricopeptide (TPR) repeat protein
LLKRGLNHYGLGDLDGAIACWEQARALDPENQAVHDYLETAYEENGGARKRAAPAPAAPRGANVFPPARAEKSAPGRIVTDDDDTPKSGPIIEFEADDDPDTQLQLALQAYKEGRYDDAWRELNDVARAQPGRLDVQGYLQLVRTERAQSWAKEIGDQGRVLRRRISTAEIMRLKLKPDEGFMLAQVDGRLSIGDLISLSTSDRVRTLEVIAKLLRDRVVSRVLRPRVTRPPTGSRSLRLAACACRRAFAVVPILASSNVGR